MARRMKPQWIPKDGEKRVTFMKRKATMLKRAQELSILCDIKACVIIYGPYDLRPDVWPSLDETAALLHRFRSLPEYQQSQRRLDLNGILRLRAEKTTNRIEKEMKAFRKPYLELLFADCLSGSRKVEDLSMEETVALSGLADNKLAEINAKMESLRARQTIFGVWIGDYRI